VRSLGRSHTFTSQNGRHTHRSTTNGDAQTFVSTRREKTATARSAGFLLRYMKNVPPGSPVATIASIPT
jgi:hypothetical protein